jgi:hypothetical protein
MKKHIYTFRHKFTKIIRIIVKKNSHFLVAVLKKLLFSDIDGIAIAFSAEWVFYHTVGE